MSDKHVVLITGASSGIGKETAKTLINAGYTVYTAARRVEKMGDLEKIGAHPIQMDVTNEASMTTGVQSILDKEGSIDILINNAGYGSYGAVEDVPVDEARRQFEVNIFGLAWLTQLVLPSHVRGGMKDTTNFVDMTPSLIKQNAHNTEFAEKLYRLSLEGK